MKILFIHNRYKYQGGEDVAVELEQKILEEHNHICEVIIFDNTEIESFKQKIKTATQAIYNSRSKKIIEFHIRNFAPDVIHVHNLFFIASPSVLYAAMKYKIPVVMTLHNYRMICANALLLRDCQICEKCVKKAVPLSGIKYRCYRNSALESALVTAVNSWHNAAGTWRNKVDQYISLTQFAREKFITSSLGLSQDQIIVKPNFIFDTEYTASKRGESYLFVGRLSVEKGVKTLLESFSSTPSKQVDIIGDGPERVALENEYGAFHNIRFLGAKSKSEVLGYMRNAKALIFPSIWYEGLPFTIIESFATGTPVIASDIGGLKNMITDAYNGVLFKTGNAAALTDALSRFEKLDSPELNANARATYIKSYHPQSHYKSIIEIYNKVIKQKKDRCEYTRQ